MSLPRGQGAALAGGAPPLARGALHSSPAASLAAPKGSGDFSPRGRMGQAGGEWALGSPVCESAEGVILLGWEWWGHLL